MAMLSGALAGLLKIGAVAVTTAGLGAGVYFLAQAGEGQDAPGGVQAPAPIETPAELSPPNAIAPTPEVTATFPPAPITPPPDIDTADWKTYVSPLGFTMKYPPDWVVVDHSAEGAARGTVKILNEVAKMRFAERLAAGQLEGAERGEAWIEVTPNAFPTFDIDALISGCVPEEAVEEPRRVAFAGLEAVRCVQEGRTPDGGRQIRAETHWVRVDGGRVLGLTSYSIDAGPQARERLAAVLSAVSFPKEAP